MPLSLITLDHTGSSGGQTGGSISCPWHENISQPLALKRLLCGCGQIRVEDTKTLFQSSAFRAVLPAGIPQLCFFWKPPIQPPLARTLSVLVIKKCLSESGSTVRRASCRPCDASVAPNLKELWPSCQTFFIMTLLSEAVRCGQEGYVCFQNLGRVGSHMATS